MFKVHSLKDKPTSAVSEDFDLPDDAVMVEATVEDETGTYLSFLYFDEEDSAYEFIKMFKTHSLKSLEPFDLETQGEEDNE